METSSHHTHRRFTQPTSTTHKYVGYTIGILSLLVTAVVIYGVGGPLFPPKKLPKVERDKGFYENIAAHIPKFFFVTNFGWLIAVFTGLIIALVITFILWFIGLGAAAACAYLYFYEGIDRQNPGFDSIYNKEREIYLIVGVSYWTTTLIIAGIWCATRRVEEPIIINETELTPIK